MRLSPADVMTVPNAVTAAGFALVAHGAQRLDTPHGAAEVVVGRLCDLVDGAVARHTGQTSEFGAGLDATADKVGLAIIGTQMVRRGILPVSIAAGMAVQNAANTVATIVAKQRHPEIELQPSTSGKIAMAAQNLAAGAYLTAELTKNSRPRLSCAARKLGFIAGWFGIGIGASATYHYFDRAR